MSASVAASVQASRGFQPGLAAAARWVEGHAEKFAPSVDADAPDTKQLKHTVELAVTLTAVVACGQPVTFPRGSELLERILRDEALIALLLRPPRRLTEVLHLYLAHEVVHGPIPTVRKALQRQLMAVDLGAQCQRHSFVEARMCVDWLELDAHGLPELDLLLDDSAVYRHRSVLDMREDDIYELTHVVMFATRYGSRLPTGDRMQRFARAAEKLLADLLVCLPQEEHWDLLGEALLCWEALQLERDRPLLAAWRSYLSVQDDDGSFPPPRIATRPDQDRSQAGSFERRYHTTLVAVLLLSAAIQRNRRLPHGRVVREG